MLGYIISNKNENQSFDILHKTDLNIYVVDNNKLLYNTNLNIYVVENNKLLYKIDKWIVHSAGCYGHVQVLEWFKNSGYEFKYTKFAFKTRFIKILKFFSHNLNIKKVIKWASNNFIKTIKFKTHNKYLKGYQKN